MGCNCGKGRALNRRGQTVREKTTTPDGTHVDPTRALFAAARPVYEVVPNGSTKGRRFSTLAAAQDYARRTGGSVRAA